MENGATDDGQNDTFGRAASWVNEHDIRASEKVLD